MIGGTKVAIAKVAKRPADVFLLVEALCDAGGAKSNVRMLCKQIMNALRCSDDIDKNDVGLLDADVEQLTNGNEGATTRGKHGVHEQDVSSSDITGELCHVILGLCGVLIALDEDLAEPDVAAAGSEGGLHGLTGAYDGDADDLSGEGDAAVGLVVDGGGDVGAVDGQEVEGELDHDAVDAVGSEDPVRRLRVLGAQSGHETAQLRRLGVHVELRVRLAVYGVAHGGREGRRWSCCSAAAAAEWDRAFQVRIVNCNGTILTGGGARDGLALYK